jgi:hypothetical protein
MGWRLSSLALLGVGFGEEFSRQASFCQSLVILWSRGTEWRPRIVSHEEAPRWSCSPGPRLVLNVTKQEWSDSHTQRTENTLAMLSAFSASLICLTAWEQLVMSMKGHWDPRRMYLRLWVELCNRCSAVLIRLVQWAFLKVIEVSFKVLIAVMVLVFWYRDIKTTCWLVGLWSVSWIYENKGFLLLSSVVKRSSILRVCGTLDMPHRSFWLKDIFIPFSRSKRPRRFTII